MTSPNDGRPAPRLRTPSATRWAVTALVALGLCAPVGGCDTQVERPLSKRNKVKVKLPPTPDLTKKEIEVKHGDGTYTVAGVLSKRGELVGRSLTVRGRVLSVTGCPEPKQAPVADAADEPAEPAAPKDCYPPPHMYLGDAGGEGERRLLVTGPMSARVADHVVGRVVTVEGDFDLVSRDGAYIRQAGLLVLPAPAPAEGAGPAADASP